MTVHDLIGEGLLEFATAWANLDGHVQAHVVAAVRSDWEANDIAPSPAFVDVAYVARRSGHRERPSSTTD